MTYYGSKGSISGRMFSDSDGDNTENKAGGYEAGLAGQTVYLLDRWGNVCKSTTTDAYGNYSFTGLSGGDYYVKFPTSVDGEGLIEKDQGAIGEDSDASQVSGKTAKICLKHGQDLYNIDAGYAVSGPDPDGVVDGEDFGETMVLGYDDSNAPTDNGGDLITNGDDTIYGNGGDDIIDGAAGDDLIYGDSGNGGGTEEVQEVFQWSELNDKYGGSLQNGEKIVSQSQDTGDNVVTLTLAKDYDNTFSTDEQKVHSIDTGDLPGADAHSSLSSNLEYCGESKSYTLDFQEEAGNISFRVNDIDYDSMIVIKAYDADGNEVPVDMSAGGGMTLQDNDGVAGEETAISNGGGGSDTSGHYSALVSIPGPITKLVITHSQTGYDDSGINITDIYFDTLVDTGGVAGDDVITGGAGADEIYGEDGDDTFIVSSASDGNGDVITGGNGPDDTTDNDVLDLRGTGQVTIVSTADGSDDGSLMGTVTFEDGSTLEFSQIETILTDPQNEAPEANDDTATVAEDGVVTIPVLDNDVDPDGDPLEIVEATVVSGEGTVEIVGGQLVFTPAPNYNGPVEISYTVQDPSGEQDTASVSVDVTPVNDDPVANDDTAETDEDSPVIINVLGNDTDIDGDDLTVTEATSPDGEVEIRPDGSIRFIPDENFNGETTITYTVSDGNGGTDTATVTVTVNAVNDDPEANDDSDTTAEDTPITVDLLANDTDVDGDDLTVISATLVSGEGEIVDNGDGTVTFVPAPDFNGEAVIDYTVSDGNGGTASASHTITVTPEGDAPVAEDDVAETDEDTPVIIRVLDNDSDPDGDPLDVTEATSPDGEVEIRDNGTIRFIPDENFNGETTITYTVTDPDGNTDTATVTVTVNAVNDAPEANNDSDVTDFNTPVTVDLLANDTDVDGDDLTVVSATVPADQGSLVDNGDGTVTFTPATGFTGTATISYTIADEEGLTDSATHTITVGDAPLDGTVEGTAGDDLIDGGYLGDPEGDRVDNDDAILPGDVGDDDLIMGFEGDDTILAGEGDDEVYGGEGDDSILGQGGEDTLFGDEGNDDILGGRDSDVIYGGDDDDTVDGAAGDDTVYGGEGDDLVIGGGGDDSLSGGAGDDTVLGDNNIDIIDGGTGDDIIDAGASADTVTGGEGSDTIQGGAGDDVIDAGNPEGDALPDVGYPGVYGADSDPSDDLDFVDGGAGNDTITTGDDDDSILGGTGHDVIDAGWDDDTVDGGDGNDTIIGNEGNDEIDGGAGNDLIYGGLDDSAPDLVNIPDDGSGPFGPDLVTDNNNDTIYGGDGNDTIFGKDDDDTLYGGTGRDVIDGGVDDDEIYGDEGNDTLTGGQGNDAIYGGDDRDVILGGNGGDVVDGGEGGDDYDVLNLTGSDVDFITYTSADQEDGIVTFLDGSTMTFEEIENVIPCFTPGTTIATPRGERLVEELREGDRIITRDNGIQEIRWIGHKQMKGTDLVRNPHLKPILIKAGALGNGLPERDMLVSPNHRVLVANDKTQLYFEEREVLAAAKHLVGSEGVHALDVMNTTYIHFMFDNHEVVLSNGAWTESFQPGDYSLKGIGNSQRSEIFELFPELQNREGRESYTAARRALKKHEARLLVK